MEMENADTAMIAVYTALLKSEGIELSHTELKDPKIRDAFSKLLYEINILRTKLDPSKSITRKRLIQIVTSHHNFTPSEKRFLLTLAPKKGVKTEKLINKTGTSNYASLKVLKKGIKDKLKKYKIHEIYKVVGMRKPPGYILIINTNHLKVTIK